MARLTILLGLWAGWRPIYQIEHVNAISRQLREYLKIPYKLVLLKDNSASGDAEVDEIRPVPKDPKGLRAIKRVNCFRRLRYFDPAYQEQFDTEWLMSLDLDTLIRGDITEQISRAMDDPFGLWILKGRFADQNGERPYNGALFMVRRGQHADVWNKFDPVESPKMIARKRWIGSDQSWIGLVAPGAPTFTPGDGFWFLGQYCKSRDLAQRKKREAELDRMVKVVNYAGQDKPWSKSTRGKAPHLYQEYLRWTDEAQRPSSTAASIS